jgi:hypothetical protein
MLNIEVKYETENDELYLTCGTTAGLNYKVDASREEWKGKVLAS